MWADPGGADLARSGLQDELKKKLPFESPEQEAMLNLARTNDTFELAFVRLFRSHKVSPPQYNILRILRGAGGEGLPCLEIAGRMVTCVPDITRLIDRLERAGLVARTRSETDRRVVNVSILAKGLELLGALDEPVLQLHKRLIGHLSRDELAELNRLLVKARNPG
jgi:DNA-binding MarR family transcriptional regulator